MADEAAMKARDYAEYSSSDSAESVTHIETTGGRWSASYLTAAIDRRLDALVHNQQQAPHILRSAIGYSVLAPGKRLRPTITLLTSFHFGQRDLLALDCACAIEMVHAASLLMDDLPAMDNAKMRRGQPTTHRKFGEDIAVLSGVALLNLAFGVVASVEGIAAPARAELVRLISNAVGSNGLVGGQVMDLRTRLAGISVQELEHLNACKTGALFAAAAEAGAVVAGAPDRMLAPVRQFALDLGRAFQIADDVLDGAAHAGRTGKDTGKDTGKPTLASVLGNDGARQLYRTYAARCRQSIADIGAAGAPLGEFVECCLSQVDV
jgi:geranylgeranyl diphosphate synthase, type II